MSEPAATRDVYLLDDWGYPFAIAQIPREQWGIGAISWDGRVYLMGDAIEGPIGYGISYRPVDALPIEAKPWRENGPPPEVPL